MEEEDVLAAGALGAGVLGLLAPEPVSEPEPEPEPEPDSFEPPVFAARESVR
ncbi:hypothetical protein [Leifsonia sp. NPDC058230]|uniref:hypothetical protein n=1 Tax=Leifsonia sp. NPDC058230 TaxID=3346391 RepID=UPI0036DF8E19